MVGFGNELDVYIYNILIRGLCKEGFLGFVCELVEEMESKGCEFNMIIYIILIDGFCKKGKFDKVCCVLG